MVKRILRVAGADITDSRDCNVYLLDSDEPVLVDAGFGAATDQLIENVRASGVEPSKIAMVLLTHCHIDHIGGASLLAEKLGARLVMHERDADIVERGDNRLTAAYCFQIQFSPLAIDLRISGPSGTIPGLSSDIHFLHTPGHTPGSISLYTDVHGKRILFGQDLGAPLLADFDCDPVAWRHSMEGLLGLNADVLCDGHSGIYEPRRVVSGYIRHFMRLYAGS